MENIIYYLKESDNKYTIQIGNCVSTDPSNNLFKLNQYSTDNKVEFLIDSNVKLLESVILFDKILHNNDDIKINTFIITELNLMTIKFLDDLASKTSKLTKDEIWTLCFIKLMFYVLCFSLFVSSLQYFLISK